MNELSLLEPIGAKPWMDSATCVGEDPNRMQPEYVSRTELVITKEEVCGPCPVRRECFQHAEDQSEPFGLHGGNWFGPDPVWLDHVCEYVGCGKQFVREPRRATKYCSPKCKRLAEKARKAAA